MAVIRCETCGANLDIDPKHFGASVRCGQCKSVFAAVPPVTAPTPLPPQDAEPASGSDAETASAPFDPVVYAEFGIQAPLQNNSPQRPTASVLEPEMVFEEPPVPRRPPIPVPTDDTLKVPVAALNTIALFELLSILVLGIGIGFVFGLDKLPFEIPRYAHKIVTIVCGICLTAIGVRDCIVLLGVQALSRRKSYNVAMFATLLTVLPVPFVIGILVVMGNGSLNPSINRYILLTAAGYSLLWFACGAWVLVYLLQPEVRESFATPLQSRIRRSPDSPKAERELAIMRLELPCAMLSAVAGLNLFWLVFSIAIYLSVVVYGPGRIPITSPEVAGNIVGLAIATLLSFFQLTGLDWIRNIKSYPMAITVAILASLPCTTCAPWTIPLGIWLLAELLRPDTRRAFR
jgi:hypothetical protein